MKGNRRVVFSMGILAAAITFVGCGAEASDAVLFDEFSEAALSDARSSGRPVVVKATADW